MQKKCGGNTRPCADSEHPEGENLCSNGMSFFRTKIGSCEITFFGLKGESNPNISRPEHLKEALKGRGVSEQNIREWAGKTSAFMGLIDQEFMQRQAEMLDPLHDPMRLARQLELKAINLLPQQQSGIGSVDDQIERAAPELKSIIKSAGLLNQSFGLLSIYFNPDSASFGRKNYTDLYGLLRKYSMTLDDTENGKHIYMSGNSYRKIPLYESFKLVPFALFSNAIKYCMEGNVNIKILELTHTISVSVESTGPLIEADELSSIFNKRIRGKWAKATGLDGNGVGLYLAKIVAHANGFNITASSTKLDRVINKIPLAKNKFSFELQYLDTP